MARDYYRDPVSGNLIAKAVKVEDTLPVGTEVDYDGTDIPEGWVEVDDPNEYSTDEKRIGTWIDGKPLYRKVISTTSATTIGTETDVATLKNVDTLVSYKGLLYRINTIINADYAYNGAQQTSTIYVSGLSGTLTFRYHTNATTNLNATLKIIVEYTKTTD